MKQRVRDRRLTPEKPAGRREGHNVAPGQKVKGKVAYTQDHRQTGLMGRRVRQTRGGRWRPADRRVTERRALILRATRAGVFQHPVRGASRDQRDGQATRRSSPDRRA